jgi:hypothetical protein
MALKGTILDFALPDIFQLIGIQRKTGLLTLQNDKDTVSLKFLEGQIVGADTSSESLEDRLGELLVRTGRVTERQLRDALRIQKSTLRRLGNILIDRGSIAEDDLVEALRVQSSQIIYRLFRWREGSYEFTPAESLDYDQHHFTPISSETVLMEGARMMDEWPLIERRIRSDRLILRKTTAGAELDLDDVAESHDDLEVDLGFDQDLQERENEPDDRLPADERDILILVDGRKTVREICDLSDLGEFETYRILADMMIHGLLEEVRTEPAPTSRARGLMSRVAGWGAQLIVFGLAAVSLLLIPSNPWTPWRILQADATTERLREYASISRLETLEGAIQVFYLDAGTVPESLEVLAGGGYLRPQDLRDPWGRPYTLEISGGGYRLVGLDARGAPNPDLSISRRFSTVQQMMMADSPEPSGSAR